MRSTVHNHIRRAAAAVALAGALVPVAPAQAGSYDVWSCRVNSLTAPAGDGISGWRPQTSGQVGLTAANRCEDAGYLVARLGGFAVPYGARAQWKFFAPPDTRITAYELSVDGHAGGTDGVTTWVGDVSLNRSDQTDPSYVFRKYGGGAVGSSVPWSANARVGEDGVNVTSIHLTAACAPGYGGSGDRECPPAPAGGETSMIRLHGSRVTLQDGSAPTLGSVSGDALDEGVFRGEETISVNAADTGSGVYRLIVSVDGQDELFQVIDDNDGRCVDPVPANAVHEFTYPQPCPLSSSGEVALDTTGLPEGEHSLRLKIEDAAGNRTTVWGPAEKVIDNVPPPAPPAGGPTLAGASRQGDTLVADPGTWTGEGIEFTYAWERCGADGAGCVRIDGATGKAYELTAADVGHRLRVVVTATNAEGTTTAASTPSAVITPGPCEAQCSPPGSGVAGDVAGGPVNGNGGSIWSLLSASYEGRTTIHTRWGERVLLTGVLRNEHGTPVTGAVVDVLERAQSASASRLVGTVTTASDGTFAYLLPVGASRTIRFGYRFRDGASEYTQTTEVEVLVKAKVPFRATRRVRGQRPVVFRGRVPGALAGSVVLLQAKVGARWQVFQKARIGKSRRFTSKYVFKRTTRPTTFAFRAVYPGRDAANLLRAASRTRKVRYTP